MKVRVVRALVSLALLIVALAIGSPLPSAQAANLRFDGCIGDLSGCHPTNPALALHNATSVSITPDGNNVYVGSGNGVSHFRADSGGNLTFAGCIGRLSGCTPPFPLVALDGTDALAMSPDGRNLYVGSSTNTSPGGDVSHLRIDSVGNLTFVDCVGNVEGCATPDPSAAVDSQLYGLAVSPDGSHLYAAVHGSGDIAYFTIGSGGNLGFDGCVGDLNGCTPTNPAGLLHLVTSVALTPDGQHLYGAAATAVNHFTIDPQGDPTFAGCVGEHSGCTPSPVPHPQGTSGNGGLVVAPNGGHLYVASVPGYVTHYTIDSGGNLGFGGCVGKASGCSPANPSNALSHGFIYTGLAIRPDRGHLYVGAADDISDLAIDSQGNLAFASCLGDDVSGCTPTNPNDALDNVLGVAVRPGGSDVYATGDSGSGQVSHLLTLNPFFLRLARIIGLVISHKVFVVGKPWTPIKGVTAAKKRRHPRGTVFSFRLDQAATVKIAIQARRPGRRSRGKCRKPTRKLKHKRRCTRNVTIFTLTRTAHAGLNKVPFTGRIRGKKLKPGRYQAVFTAIDAAGKSQPETLRFRIVRR